MKPISQSTITDKFLQKSYWVAYKLKLLYNFIFYPTTYGVYIAVWCKGKVLMIKNSYKSYYTLPCGGLKKGETTELGAIRELFEEVNIKASTKELIFIGGFLSQVEFMNDHITLYELNFTDFPEFQCDNQEVIWADFKKPGEILGMDLFPLVRIYLSNKLGVTKNEK